MTFLVQRMSGRAHFGKFDLHRRRRHRVAVLFAILRMTSFWTETFRLPLSRAYAFLWAIAYAYWREKSGSLLPSIVGHNVGNFVAELLPRSLAVVLKRLGRLPSHNEVHVRIARENLSANADSKDKGGLWPPVRLRRSLGMLFVVTGGELTPRTVVVVDKMKGQSHLPAYFQLPPSLANLRRRRVDLTPIRRPTSARGNRGRS
jgi:CAAX prenyl protease-like protein